MKKEAQLSKVVVGQVIEQFIRPDEPKKQYVVEKSCGQDSRHGRWCCVTHDKTFENQFQKDSHIYSGKHQLAWWCPIDCTYEVP